MHHKHLQTIFLYTVSSISTQYKLTESTGIGVFGGRQAMHTSREQWRQTGAETEADGFIHVEEEEQQQHDTDCDWDEKRRRLAGNCTQQDRHVRC